MSNVSQVTESNYLMSSMAESGDQQLDSQEQLNSQEFPPLPARTKLETLVTSSSASFTMMRRSPRGHTTKRSMRNDDDDLSGEDTLTLSSASAASSGSLTSSSSSPLKKSRRLEYRDPPPILSSLDTDGLKNLFDSPLLSDSQGSETGYEIKFSKNFASPLNTTSCSSLGSLTDVIEKYNSTNLGSFQGLENLGHFSENAQSSPWIRSPASVHMESPDTPQGCPPFPIGASPACTTAGLPSPTDVIKSLTQAELSRHENSVSDTQPFVVPGPGVRSVMTSSSVEIKLATSANGSESQEVKYEEKYTNMTVSASTSEAQNPPQSNLMSCDFEINTGPSASTELTCDFGRNTRLGNETNTNSQDTASVASEPASFEEHVGSPEDHKAGKSRGKAKVKNSKRTPKISKDSNGKNHKERHNVGQNVKNSPEEEDSKDDSNDSNSSGEKLGTFEGDFEFNKCRKNPGHKRFHTPNDLEVKQLPLEIQNEDSVTCLNCLSQLVVQISVYSTSSAREADDEYSDYIGTNRKRNGSGFIAAVDEDIRKFRCRVEDCPHGSAPDGLNSSSEDSVNTSFSSPSYDRNLSNMSTASTSSSSSTNSQSARHYYYSGVRIHTNKHIVYDMSEAKNAYVKFFYNTPDGRGVIDGHVAAIAGINNSQDHVVLHVMSHNKALFDMINVHMKNARSSYKQMVRSTDRMHQVHGHKYKHSWVAIISHPHGTSKKISLGRIQKEILDGMRIVKFYDAATCPGSSGGLVLTPSLLKLQWPGAVHSGTDSKSGYNITFDSRVQDLDYKVIGKINKSLIHRKSNDSLDNSSQ